MRSLAFLAIASLVSADESCGRDVADETTLLQGRTSTVVSREKDTVAEEQADVTDASTGLPGEPQYIGCFTDNRGRDMGRWLGDRNNDATNTFAGCASACDKTYMSLQSGGECFCSDSYGRDGYNQVDDSQCGPVDHINANCASNSHSCGGHWRNAVYRNPGQGAEHYIGCFTDNRGRDMGRWLGDRNNDATNTFAGCAGACDKAYMSLQSGGECFCSDSYGGDGYNQVDDSQCGPVDHINANCASNSYSCGGHWRNAVYRTPRHSAASLLQESQAFVQEEEMESEMTEETSYDSGEVDFEMEETGSSRSSRRRDGPSGVYHRAPAGAGTCDFGHSPTEANPSCARAVNQVARAAGQSPGRALQIGSGGGCLDGSWGQVPTGCSIQSGGDWAGHFKSGATQQDRCVHSAYQLVCAGRNSVVIRNAHSGRRLFAQRGRSHESGVGAGTGGTIFADQRWNIRHVGRGKYTITNAHSGRRLFAQSNRRHERGVGASNGATVFEDQKWYIEDLENGKFVIRNAHSSRRLFAQRGRSHESGVGADDGNTAHADQKWYIE